MTDYGSPLQFGPSITPEAAEIEAITDLARLADATGLDADHLSAAKTQAEDIVPQVRELVDAARVLAQVSGRQVLAGRRCT